MTSSWNVGTLELEARSAKDYAEATDAALGQAAEMVGGLDWFEVLTMKGEVRGGVRCAYEIGLRAGRGGPVDAGSFGRVPDSGERVVTQSDPDGFSPATDRALQSAPDGSRFEVLGLSGTIEAGRISSWQVKVAVA